MFNRSQTLSAIAPTVHKHFELARDTIEAQSETPVKFLGDGTMSSFSSARVALTVAAELQQRNAAELDEPSLQIRIGLHTGDVIQTDDDFFGAVVNKAARIPAVAAPGEVCVSDATQVLVGTGRTDLWRAVVGYTERSPRQSHFIQSEMVGR